LSEPLGLGVGSHGLASRVASQGQGGIGDSTGYVETLRTYGWLGFMLIVSVFCILWNATRELMRTGVADPNLYLFRVWFISGLVAAFSGSWMFTATFFWVLAGYCLKRSDDTASLNAQMNDDDFDVSTHEWGSELHRPSRVQPPI
jgi:hypothetical protein